MNQNKMPRSAMHFLTSRQQGISLKPTASPNAGYVWRRVFLKGERRKEN